MSYSSDIQSKTIVFTLPKGCRVTPQDFLPALNVISGKITAFGTVGVSHVWHLTLDDLNDVDSLVDQGDFKVKSYPVAVTKFDDGCYSATLHWLPFWVPNCVVESCIGSLLSDDIIHSSYVRIPQPGFKDCFGTQRKINSAKDLKKLPYFVPVKYEGTVYRTCLFVPGRDPICFQCNAIGHMRNQCTIEKTTAQTSHICDPETKDVSSEHTKDSSSETEKEEDMEELEVQQGPEAENPVKPASFRIIYATNNKEKYYSNNGIVAVVTPPHHLIADPEELDDLALCCKSRRSRRPMSSYCILLEEWNASEITENYMRQHFHEYHPSYSLEQC